MPNITLERFFCNEGEEPYRGIDTGDTIIIDYGRKERYKAVVKDDTVYYEDGKKDFLRTILEQAVNGICTVIRVTPNSSIPFLTLDKGQRKNGMLKWMRGFVNLGDRDSRLEAVH